MVLHTVGMSTKFSNTPNYTDFNFFERASKKKSVDTWTVFFLCQVWKKLQPFLSKTQAILVTCLPI